MQQLYACRAVAQGACVSRVDNALYNPRVHSDDFLNTRKHKRRYVEVFAHLMKAEAGHGEM